MTTFPIPFVIVFGMLLWGCTKKANQGSDQTSVNPPNPPEEMAKDSTIKKLIGQLASSDAAAREQALANLTKQGSKAVPALSQQVNTPGTPAKDLLVQALANIGDTSSAALFKTLLSDGNARVRAMAAQGLVKLKHPDAVDALIATLHDYGDETSPFTTSAYSLIDYGAEALPKVVGLLSDSSIYTREMGYNILAQIVTKMPSYEHKWKELSAELGNYDPGGAPAEREAATRKWAEWVESLSKN